MKINKEDVIYYGIIATGVAVTAYTVYELGIIDKIKYMLKETENV